MFTPLPSWLSACWFPKASSSDVLLYRVSRSLTLDRHLISPYNITPDSHIQVTWIKEMNAN